jgi:ubiquinone/menaquinone biosynthesis C-methylase UbiE
MGILSVLKNITHGYSPAESAIFDRFAAAIATPLWTFSIDHIAPQVLPGMRLLDVGCGGGQFAIQLAQRFPEVRIVGVDLSPEQIGRAQSRVDALRERVSFVEGNAIDLPFADAEFDLVYSLGSIKHWPERGRGLAECARVLVPGGHLWLIEGDRGCRIEDVRALISTWNLPRPLHPLAISFFRNVVAGNSLDVDEARTLVASISTIEGSVERGEGLPLWMITGKRRDD